MRERGFVRNLRNEQRGVRSDHKLHVDVLCSAAEPRRQATIKALKRAGNRAGAELIKKLSSVPRAVWLVGGTPNEVKEQVEEVVDAASCKHELPVFVLYDLLFREVSALAISSSLRQIIGVGVTRVNGRAGRRARRSATRTIQARSSSRA